MPTVVYILSSIIANCGHLVKKKVTIATKSRLHRLFLQNIQEFKSISLKTNQILSTQHRYYVISNRIKLETMKFKHSCIIFFLCSKFMELKNLFYFVLPCISFFLLLFLSFVVKNGSLTYHHRQDWSF